MRLNAIASIVECPRHVPEAFTSPPSVRKCEQDRTVCWIVLSSPFASSKNLGNFNKTLSGGQTIWRSCRSNLGGFFCEDPSMHREQLGKRFGVWDGREDEGLRKNKLQCGISERNFSSNKHGMKEDSYSSSQFYFLEPMMLGIRPDPPDWPEREAVMRATIEQKAKRFDLPVSVRMIKKKLQLKEGFTDFGDSDGCSLKKAFASMVLTMAELQSCALQVREALPYQDLEMIMAKVQKEMYSSFVWLFERVFSRTPSLMIYVMVLLANFSVYSASLNLSTTTFVTGDGSGGTVGENVLIGNVPGEHDLRSVAEVILWDSMVDESMMKMQTCLWNEVLDHDTIQNFVSPVFVELEPDDYEIYLRTDLLYQMNLSQEPNNSLLLCNYARFLFLVTHDYARADECFKRAVQVLPHDTESLIQHANFLWIVKGDFWGAEERFLKALAAEPENSYYASRYASFLWSTGSEETCYPLDSSHSSA